MLKEFEDLMEDEEEDVVCASVESAIKIIEFLHVAFKTDRTSIEKFIMPIIMKIISLSASKAKVGVSIAKIQDKIMKESGKLL